MKKQLAKLYYIVTMSIYIGHDPFDDKNAVGGMDIQTICKSFEDAHAYIDRTIAYNDEGNDRRVGKGVITCRVEKPDFFKGHEVDVYFTDTRENKKWMWVFSVYERTLFDPKKRQVINKELCAALEEVEDDVRKGNYFSNEEFKQKIDSWFNEKKI